MVYEPALLQVQLEVTGLICNIDSNAVIRALVEGGVPTYWYAWNTGANSSRIDQLGPGTYALTVTDRNGCTATAETTISQPSPPTIQVETVEPACFGGKDGYFRLLVSNGAIPYRYSLDGQNFNGSSVFLGLGAGQYTAYVRDGKGCITAATATLNQPPPVEVSLPPDTTLTLGDSLLISATLLQAVEPVSYFWDGALVDSFRCADLPECSSIWIFPAYTNTFSVTVFDADGCSGKASIRIELEKPRGAFVPTGFSPNGDFNNDLLVVHGKSRQIRQVKLFRVYDRWGELLYEDQEFQVNDEQRGWDGRFRGQECRPGVYVWHLVVEYLDGYEQALQGNTTLIR